MHIQSRLQCEVTGISALGKNRFSLFMESRANACIIIFGLQNGKMFFCSPKTR